MIILKSKKFLSFFLTVATTIPVVLGSICTASATDISIGELDIESTILAEENAFLQKYSIDDIIATQSFLLNREYDGIGRVVDADDDGVIDVFDLCRMKREYKENGNYYDLLFKFMQSTEDQYAVESENDEFVSNRVIVQGTHELDFSKFAPTSILGDSEYYYLLQFDSFSEAKNCISVLENEEGVVCAQMDGTIETPPDEESQLDVSSLDVDVSSLSWGVSAIEADKYASFLSKNYNGQVTVAVIDTGVAKHSFLNSRIINGGRDIVNNDDDPSDDNGHGTHVAGTIVDCTPGLNINIMPIKVLKYDGGGSDAQVIAGIKWARQNHVDVINLSLGSINRVPPGGAIEYAVNQAVAEGITVVKAAGNENDDTKYRSPSNASAPIVVAAVDSSLNRAKNSNYGSSVDLCAPGVNIKSSTYDGGYGYKSGTSMAAPHIAAAAAMVKYQYPNYTPAQIESTLTNVCMDLGTKGKDFYYGYGIPKLSNLIKEQINPSINLSTKSLSMYKGQKSTLSASVSPGDVDVKWNTSNASVATVNNGIVTATGTGSATITAFFAYNGTNYSATCSVTVKSPGLTLSETSKSMYQTNTFDLIASVVPSGQSVFWTTSNSNVATVSNGRVTAVNPGTATITASMSYNGETYSASCIVIVKEVSVKLDQTSKTVYQTDEFSLSATATPSGQTISWASSYTNVAKVSNGKITAINPGTANITASITYGGKTFSATCTVTVKKVSLELNTRSKSLIIGDNYSLVATTSPSGLTVTWESVNNMIASVSAGKVNAKAPGNVTISATMTYNGKEYSDSCNITVVEPSVKLSQSQVKISKNETFKLTGETLPSNQTISWSSEDTSICSIDSTGTITGKSIGNTMVYATIIYGGVSYKTSCNVIVGEPKVTLNKTAMTMYVGDTQSLIASVIAVDGVDISSETKSDISWSTSNSTVAIVDSNGSVKGLSTGTATITAKYTFCDVNYTATCKITIDGKPGISLNKSSLSLYIGDTSTLSSTVTPTGSVITWSSSNTNVATINSSGKVSAISSGTATITASIRYNGVNYSTSCSVKVTKPTITLSSTSGSVYQGASVSISATTNPSGYSVTWSSSNSNVASVSGGKITGKSAGSATITAKFTYQGNTYSTSYSVTVKAISLSLSSYSGSAYSDDYYVLSSSEAGYYISLPTASYSPTSGNITWKVVSGNAYISGSYLYILQPGSCTARCTYTYNGYSVSKDYTFKWSAYKTTTKGNYFRSGPGTGYSQIGVIPAGVTVEFTEIYQNGTSSSGDLWGKTSYNGMIGWIIIGSWW